MPSRDRSKSVIAKAAWRELFDFILATASHRNRVLRDLGLTPNDSRALGTLAAGRGRTMRSLAEEWQCDASTATWIVNSLARRHLVHRRSATHDRRVTLVSLTSRGQQTKAQLLRGVYTPPRELLDLSAEDLASLRDAAAKLKPGRERRA